MKKISLAYVICGSFCTMERSIKEMEKLSKLGYEIIPVMSYNAFNWDTKFGKALDFRLKIENICRKQIIHTIPDAEPIGPQKMADIMLIAPCTGNTLAKLTNGITDTPALMAAKSHLRINRPLVIALATNDALGASAQNLGKILNTKNVYMVPLKQDSPTIKPHSMVSNFDLISETIDMAMNNKQIQPCFI